MDFNVLIDLRYSTDEWGPFSIDLDRGLPEGESVSDVTIKAFSGRIFPTDSISGLTDIAAQIIETGSIINTGTQIQWKMQYPSDSTLKDTKATLIFEVTTTGGGEHPFYLYAVRIS